MDGVGGVCPHLEVEKAVIGGDGGGTDDERHELERLTKRTRVNRALAFRARVVLACAEPQPNTVVAKRYHTTNATVGKWRRRFIADRVAGLFDEPRVGAPRTVLDDEVEAVIVRPRIVFMGNNFGVLEYWSIGVMVSLYRFV